MTAFQRDALQDFVDDGAKDHPPVFVGREDLLGEILTEARRTMERVRSGQQAVPGNAIIIQGAPGAGKSSVLRELATQNVQPHVPKTLEISSVELCDQFGDVLQAIGALGTTPKSQLKKLAQTATRTLGNLALLDVLGGADLSLNLAALFQSHNIETIGSLHQAFPASQWDSPVIVAVDEAQNLAPSRDSTYSRFLRAIHEARTKLPLTLVCAGLGDTQSRLHDLGLTHGIRAHSLGGPDPRGIDHTPGPVLRPFRDDDGEGPRPGAGGDGHHRRLAPACALGAAGPRRGGAGAGHQRGSRQDRRLGPGAGAQRYPPARLLCHPVQPGHGPVTPAGGTCDVGAEEGPDGGSTHTHQTGDRLG